MRDYTIHQAIAILARMYPGTFSFAEHELNTYAIDPVCRSKTCGKRVYNEDFGHSEYCGTYRAAIKDLAGKADVIKLARSAGENNDAIVK